MNMNMTKKKKKSKKKNGKLGGLFWVSLDDKLMICFCWLGLGADDIEYMDFHFLGMCMIGTKMCNVRG